MKFVSLPTDEVRSLSFYLAMEEYVAKCVQEATCFFMWQVEPSVIFGRNQLIENEVNLAYCRANGIQMFRRKSGGGCVYADWSNIMFSYITDDVNVRFTFDKYIRLVAFVLRKLGVAAEATGRNDILIDGKKVSGNAFYHLPGRSIVHGTMLFDTDLAAMVKAITPSNEKLISKGVESVRQRVTNLSEHLSITIDEFKAFVREQMCDGEIVLTPQQVEQIKEIEKGYLSDEFIYGNNPRYTLVRRGRLPHVGEMEIRVAIKNGTIRDVNLLGDYFLVGDIDKGLIGKLRGVAFTEEAVREALDGVPLDELVHHLQKEDFIHLMFEND